MNEISFWQSAPFGVIVAAAMTAASTWLLWVITRRRDDLLESRRNRQVAGVDALRVAYRLRDTCTELLASIGALQGPKLSKEAYAERDRRFDAWQEASHEMGEQLLLAQALAGAEVWVALKMLASVERTQMVRLIEQKAIDGDDASKFQESMDWLLQELANSVRVDSRTDLGARSHSSSSRRKRRQVKLIESTTSPATLKDDDRPAHCEVSAGDVLFGRLR